MTFLIKIFRVFTVTVAVLGMGPVLFLVALAVAFNDYLALFVLPWWVWVLWLGCVGAEGCFAWQRSRSID